MGMPVNFQDTFNRPAGWRSGARRSRTRVRPANNQNFIYQRFQRGIMHFAIGQGTRGILLADYLKAIILGPHRPRSTAPTCRPT